ncbi:MAG: UDP-N-acetylmuramoyl-tripeptide--D-alanyl-D-alanine ligase [Aggregatilineales bacterium]
MVFGQLLALAWWIGGCWRVYQLARFFQLEGYQANRFLRWEVTNSAERLYFLKNVGILALFGLICVLLSSAVTDTDSRRTISSVVLILAFLTLAGVVARLPEREVKQTFTRTSRATRLLIAACFVQGALTLVIVSAIPLAASPFTLFSIAAGGWIAFLLAPLTLPIGNVITSPIEAAIRQSYLRSARQALDRAHPTVIAITGSYGKTSTKEYVAHLLGARYRVLKTPKSYNTLMGVCKIINQILPNDQSYEYFVVEMGAYIPGEIAAICRLVKPTISLVTAVGPMHLERFGSLDNTARAKYEIIEALPSDGAAIFNDDDPRVQAMHARGYPETRIGITRQDVPGARFSARNVQMSIDGLDFDVRDSDTDETVHLHAPVYGEHNVSNLLMAIAVAHHAGIPLMELAHRAATAQPAEHRLVRRILSNGVVTIDDAYSANPVGSRQALAVLALNQNGRRIAITSGMVELGPIQADENRKLGTAIAQTATDVVLINAQQTEPIQQGLREANFPAARLHIVETTAEAVQWMTINARAGDAVLIMADLPDTY